MHNLPIFKFIISFFILHREPSGMTNDGITHACHCQTKEYIHPLFQYAKDTIDKPVFDLIRLNHQHLYVCCDLHFYILIYGLINVSGMFFRGKYEKIPTQHLAIYQHFYLPFIVTILCNYYISSSIEMNSLEIYRCKKTVKIKPKKEYYLNQGQKLTRVWNE